MPSSSDHHVTRSRTQQDVSTASTAAMPALSSQGETEQSHREPAMPIITGPLSSPLPRSTDLLPTTSPFVTRKLPGVSITTSTKVPTVIPASTKRQRIPSQTPQARQRRPAVFFSVLASCAAMLIFVALFAAPLGSGQNSRSIAQTIGNFISTGPLNSFNPLQHMPTPSPTPAILTNEGYCGGTDIWGTCATAVTASGVMGTGQMQRPINGAVITQAFGHPEYQSWCGCVKPHSGIDLAAAYETPVMAADSGQVIWTGWDWSGLGWAVKINHGHYIATIYGHLARFVVKTGQNVLKGDVIAYEGSTGASTGPHLHFMVLVNNIWLDPTSYVALP
ncbi:MAG TPA: M23 family metallopeptidase [Ktedonobacteraceae bacterium]|nr:M23 family metallopeptidase [Ktedonobacteraceae bacterium]